MSLSLREQLLQAGLVTEKQAKQAERQASQQQHQQKKNKSAPKPDPQAAAKQAQAEKAARDLELNRKKQEKAERKARSAEINQLVTQNRVPRVESDEHYNFIDGGKIHHIAVNGRMREQIICGELVVARYRGFYALVPAAIAARIRERDPNAVIPHVASASDQPPDENDPYKDFVVPDDLKW